MKSNTASGKNGKFAIVVFTVHMMDFARDVAL